jgi:hypothetical protein
MTNSFGLGTRDSVDFWVEGGKTTDRYKAASGGLYKMASSHHPYHRRTIPECFHLSNRPRCPGLLEVPWEARLAGVVFQAGRV